MVVNKLIKPFWPEDADFSEPIIGDTYRVELENGYQVGTATVTTIYPEFTCLFNVDTGLFTDFELLYCTEHITGESIEPKFIVELSYKSDI